MSSATVTTAINQKGRPIWEKELDADMAKELKFIGGTHDHGSNGRARSIWEKELRTLAVETRRQEDAKAESPAEAALHFQRSQQQSRWKPQCWSCQHQPALKSEERRSEQWDLRSWNEELGTRNLENGNGGKETGQYVLSR